MSHESEAEPVVGSIPDLIIEGAGTFTPAAMTDLEIEALKKRTEHKGRSEKAWRDDIYRLLAEIERLKSTQ